MQYVSTEEKQKLEQKLEAMRVAKIEVQERIRAAAALGDLSENAEYHFAKEENRKVEKEMLELEEKIKNVAVVNADDVPEDMVFLGHTVRLMDLDDETETLVRIVGEMDGPDEDDEVLVVSSSSPMAEALLKQKVGDKVKVDAPAGTMEFEIMEIL
ncbi:MAG: GreA/GreB family elongation factor [Planctomycetota bacterium]